jgi:hypothetical protein
MAGVYGRAVGDALGDPGAVDRRVVRVLEVRDVEREAGDILDADIDEALSRRRDGVPVAVAGVDVNERVRVGEERVRGIADERLAAVGIGLAAVLGRQEREPVGLDDDDARSLVQRVNDRVYHGAVL